jgi:hypothetical protein
MSEDREIRKVNDTARTNSPTAWVVGAVCLVALLGGLFLYDGHKDSIPTSGSNPPNVVTGSSGSAK